MGRVAVHTYACSETRTQTGSHRLVSPPPPTTIREPPSMLIENEPMGNRRASSSPLKSNCRVYLTNHDTSLSHKKNFSPNKSKMSCCFYCVFFFLILPPLFTHFRRSHAFLPCAPSVSVVSMCSVFMRFLCSISPGSSLVNVPKPSWCRGEHVCGCVGTWGRFPSRKGNGRS
jgi:hypothetical protein